MSAIKSTTGLVSGINIGSIVDAMINAEHTPIDHLQARLTNIQTTQAGIGQLEAQLLSLSTSVSQLTNRNTFTSLQVANSDPNQLSVTTKLNSITGSYQFQAVQLATTQRSLSRGFANAAVQQIGTTGKLVLEHGGQLNAPVKLDLLNGGQGVRRGAIRIADRAGEVNQVDLSNAVTISDVVDAINTQAPGVHAETRGDHLLLTDLTGQTATNLTVTDISGGHTAQDLGLAQSVAGGTLTGNSVFRVTDQFSLDLLNDGNGLRPVSGGGGLAFTLADGTQFQVSLNGASNLSDVISKINTQTGNGGKLTAALTNGRLVLTDTTSGAGTLQVGDFGGGNATHVLGFDLASSGGVLTSRALTGGLNSVLLHNLHGGQGVAQLGQITLADRTGATATVNLSNAQTLDDVLTAINTAATSGNTPLRLHAQLDAQGTGIVVQDTSGSTTGNLTIADVGSGTTSTDLGIAVNSAANAVSSGNLGLRRVNEATSLSTYSPKGTAVSTGSFRITDSAGQQAVVNITSGSKTIGDVLDRINSVGGIGVSAKLNDTGDGIVLVDNAGGTGTLQVSEVSGHTASDLHLLGAATTGGDGKQRIASRDALVVDVAATDTLTDISTKINLVGGTVRAAVVDTGAAVNGFKLSLYSTVAGHSGGFVVDDQGVGLGIGVQEAGHDAVLRVGSDPATAFLKTSTSNTFTGAVAGLDVTLLKVSSQAATVTTSPDTGKIQTALQDFVTAYNAYVDKSAELTKYDSATQSRSALQGTSYPLDIQSRFNTLINKLIGPEGNSVRSLADVGIRLDNGGKLAFDTSRLADALQNHPDEVRSLFADVTNGFGAQFNKALNGFTDQSTGMLTLQSNALQTSSDDLTKRISQLNDLLTTRRAQLEQQFANMETVLSGLQSQATALNGLTNILAGLTNTTPSSSSK